MWVEGRCEGSRRKVGLGSLMLTSQRINKSLKTKQQQQRNTLWNYPRFLLSLKSNY